MPKSLLLCPVLLAFAQTIALANTCDGNESPPYQLEPVVVRERSDDVKADNPFYLPQSSRAATWSITREAIESLKPHDLFDILSYAPGVELSFRRSFSGRKIACL